MMRIPSYRFLALAVLFLLSLPAPGNGFVPHIQPELPMKKSAMIAKPRSHIYTERTLLGGNNDKSKPSFVEAWSLRKVGHSRVRSIGPLGMTASDHSDPSDTASSVTVPPRPPFGYQALTTNIESAQALDEYLASDDRISLILFHASWCKSCQKFMQRYNKLALEQADWVHCSDKGVIDRSGSIRMALIECGANMDLCEKLKVQKVPTVLFYRKGKKVATVAVGPSQFAVVGETLAELMEQTMQEEQFEDNLARGSGMVSSVVRHAATPERQVETPAGTTRKA